MYDACVPPGFLIDLLKCQSKCLFINKLIDPWLNKKGILIEEV